MKKKEFTSLLEEARVSEHNESYRVLEKNEDIRIGAVARITTDGTPSFFLEVTVSLNPSETVDLDALDRKIIFLKKLEARGYTLSCQDESTICSEIQTTENNIPNDFTTIKTIMDETPSDARYTRCLVEPQLRGRELKEYHERNEVLE